MTIKRERERERQDQRGRENKKIDRESYDIGIDQGKIRTSRELEKDKRREIK